MEKSIKYSFFIATYYFEHSQKSTEIYQKIKSSEEHDQSAIFYRIKLKLLDLPVRNIRNVADHKT